MRSLLMLAATCLVLLISGRVAAQGTNATLSGTVTDPTGAAVVGAVITAQNVGTGVALNTKTNEVGVYLFPSLQPGVYRLSAEKTGFRKLVYHEVTLEVSARVGVNLQLEVGALNESAVEVNAALDTTLALGASSVGSVVTKQQVQDLPLPNRDALLGLVSLQAGVVGHNFSGARRGTLNITRDGINVMDQRINSGVSSTIFTSVDLVDEFRVVTSPADAEFGRGSGQVQIITRSGTNEFHGSLFESHRNTALNANTWFNNLRSDPRNVLIRNQFGGRLGGPVIRNRTFFHVLFEGQRIRTKDSVTPTVYTQTARQGIYRFYPGMRNANANAAVPTVDLAGNPVRPAGATGELQSVNLFGRDPNRRVADPSGVVPRLMGLIPLPNNFRVGDGLNTAGYTWSRPGNDDFNHFSLKLDHQFNSQHRLSFSYTHETRDGLNTFMAQLFPDTAGGNSARRSGFYSLSVVSALTPSLVNEFRAGAQRTLFRFFAPWETEKGKALLPKVGDQMYLTAFAAITNTTDIANGPIERISPIYQYADTLTWVKGRHAFKGGLEVRFVTATGFNSFDLMPIATFGAGGVAVQNINTIAGIGQNTASAQNLLIDLTGSLASVRQAFNSPGGTDPVYVPSLTRHRAWKNREFSLFFKDDFRLKPNLTMNLGARYEFYGVPYEAHGKTTGLVGGSAGLFGISGTGFADLFQPGRQSGSLTRLELVGPNSPNPKTKLYGNDWNNVAPALGLSWSIPYFGKDKTVLRMGYGIGYERDSLRIFDIVAGDQPGLRTVTTFRTNSYFDLARISLPLKPEGKPLDLAPVDERTQDVRSFDTNLRTAYVQNWNVTLQRQLIKGITLDLRYVGNKGSKLIRATNINEANIFETGILEAFRTTQAGGNSPLLDRIFMGLNLAGLGTVNGTTITGSDLVRANSSTQGFLAGNNVGGFANYLNTSTQFTGVAGGLLRRAGFPENFITVNPQFALATLTANFANSTYHALQVEVNKRFSSGWQLQSNYIWSRAFGEEEGDTEGQRDDYRTLRNLRLDKRLLSFHRTHVFHNSGTWELPFGPKKRFLGDRAGLLGRLVERWQIGVIFNYFSGTPIDVVAAVSSFNQYADNTPVVVGPFPKGAGSVKVTDNGVIYFNGLQQVTDPSVTGLTTKNNIQGISNLKAIVDASGRLLLVNPTPGRLGNLDSRYLEGPGTFRFDVNLVKRIRIKENKNFELRATAIDVLNHPLWGNPNTDINSTNFGRITGAGGNRIMVIELRLNF